jgi:ABC-type iron transport system FetAB permease component
MTGQESAIYSDHRDRVATIIGMIGGRPVESNRQEIREAIRLAVLDAIDCETAVRGLRCMPGDRLPDLFRMLDAIADAVCDG